MSSDLARPNPAELSTELRDLGEIAMGFAGASRSPRTLRSYGTAWRGFTGWCVERGLETLPASPATVALYLTARAEGGSSVSSMSIDLSAIAHAHKAARMDAPTPKSSPELGNVWEGIRRTVGTAPKRKAALSVQDLRRMVETCPDGLGGLRDRALLILGFAGALRRSELVALQVSDVAFVAEGMTITVRRSKTDQVGAGASVGVRFGSSPVTCPVRAAHAWLDAAGHVEGPLLRAVSRHGTLGGALSPRDVARRVKAAALRVGLDPKTVAGHSLRAGLATAAAKAGVRTSEIMTQGRWRSSRMVDEVYVRPATVFESGAAGVL